MTAALATGALTGAATANDAPVSQRYAVIRIAELGDFAPDAGVQFPNADHQGTMGINNFGEVVYAHNPHNVEFPASR